MRLSERARDHIRSNAVAYVALFVALNAGAYAATVAPKNSVSSRSLKNGAVKTRDLAGSAVTSQKVADDSLGGTDIDESTLRGLLRESDLDGRLDGLLRGSDAIAGGDLGGTYAAPQLNQGSVGSGELGPGSVGTGELAALPSAGLEGPISNVDVNTAECLGNDTEFPNNTYQSIQFARVRFDNAGFANKPDPSEDCFNRFEAPLAGTYLATASVGWEPHATGSRKIALFAGPPGSTDYDLHTSSQVPGGPTGYDTRQSVAGIARLEAGDHVWLQGYQSSGTTLGFVNSDQSGIQIAWIGP